MINSENWVWYRAIVSRGGVVPNPPSIGCSHHQMSAIFPLRAQSKHARYCPIAPRGAPNTATQNYTLSLAKSIHSISNWPCNYISKQTYTNMHAASACAKCPRKTYICLMSWREMAILLEGLDNRLTSYLAIVSYSVLRKSIGHLQWLFVIFKTAQDGISTVTTTAHNN